MRRRNSGGDTILELQGKLDSSLPAELREEALSLVEPGCRLVLDLSGLKEVSPTDVRMLLMFFRRVRAGGGTISVTDASPTVFEVAEAAGYLDLFRKTAPLAPVPTRAVVSRIDAYPTHTIAGYAVRPGSPTPFGATLVPGGVNFAVYSRHATACTLVLFETGAKQPRFGVSPHRDDQGRDGRGLRGDEHALGVARFRAAIPARMKMARAGQYRDAVAGRYLRSGPRNAANRSGQNLRRRPGDHHPHRSLNLPSSRRSGLGVNRCATHG